MRLPILLLILVVLAVQLVSAQEKIKIEETYIRRDIPQPFIVRWIKDLIGPGFGQITKLELRTDGTFYYTYNDRYCGTFDFEGGGTWIKENNRLILAPRDCYLPIEPSWIIHKGRLYASPGSLNNRIWAMKRNK